MRKLLYTFVGMALFSFSAKAQQLTQFTQYQNNMFLINPAFTGSNENLDINLGYRKQWSGFNGSPQSFYLTANKAFKPAAPVQNFSIRVSDPNSVPQQETEPKKISHGLGLAVASNKFGAFNRTAAYLSYGLHYKLNDKLKLAVGAALGVSNLRIDQSQLIFENPADNVIVAGSNANTFIDANLGVLLYSKNLMIGYSAMQMLRNKVSFGVLGTESNLHINHLFTAGYKIQAGENLTLTPSVLVKYSAPSPLSFDVNLMASFKNLVWGGISYRKQDAFCAIAGITLKEKYRIGYSYDYTTSNLKVTSNGSHELFLGVSF